MSQVQGFAQISELVTLSGVREKDGRKPLPEDIGIIKNGAIVFNDDEILWVGSSDDLPTKYQTIKWTSLKGKTLTPEIVASHTHLIFGGDRSKEYSMRLNGASYAEIANAGGGIISTTTQTNEATRKELYSLTKERILRLNSYGIGTIEIKSGYGLNIEKEVECSEVIAELKEELAPKIQIFNTFMAAHAIPKSFTSAKDYIDTVVLPALEKVHDKIDAIDIFHEEGYFSTEDVKHLFDSAKKYNIPFKTHADEFQDNGGAKLASEYECLSTDHLLCTGIEGIKALANAKTVATILPGTGFFLGKPQSNARGLIDAGAKLSLASDYNPGSCHCDNLLLIAAISAPTLKLTQVELWSAITHNAAAALGLYNQGALVPGLKPRFSCFKAKSIDEITYHWGRNFACPLSDS